MKCDVTSHWSPLLNQPYNHNHVARIRKHGCNWHCSRSNRRIYTNLHIAATASARNCLCCASFPQIDWRLPLLVIRGSGSHTANLKVTDSLSVPYKLAKLSSSSPENILGCRRDYQRAWQLKDPDKQDPVAIFLDFTIAMDRPQRQCPRQAFSLMSTTPCSHGLLYRRAPHLQTFLRRPAGNLEGCACPPRPPRLV